MTPCVKQKRPRSHQAFTLCGRNWQWTPAEQDERSHSREAGKPRTRACGPRWPSRPAVRASKPSIEKRAKACFVAAGHVCDLANAAKLAMVVLDSKDLFLFAADQLDTHGPNILPGKQYAVELFGAIRFE